MCFNLKLRAAFTETQHTAKVFTSTQQLPAGLSREVMHHSDGDSFISNEKVQLQDPQLVLLSLSVSQLFFVGNDDSNSRTNHY